MAAERPVMERVKAVELKNEISAMRSSLNDSLVRFDYERHIRRHEMFEEFTKYRNNSFTSPVRIISDEPISCSVPPHISKSFYHLGYASTMVDISFHVYTINYSCAGTTPKQSYCNISFRPLPNEPYT